MKTKGILSIVLAIALVAGFGFNSIAQSEHGHGKKGDGFSKKAAHLNQDRQKFDKCAFLKLSDDQQTQVAKLKLALSEKNLPLRNSLGEMRAKMHTLQTGDGQDLKAIYKLIDEMGGVQVQIRKNEAAHRLGVRALLTDEQKIMFDAHQFRKYGTKLGNKPPRAK